MLRGNSLRSVMLQGAFQVAQGALWQCMILVVGAMLEVLRKFLAGNLSVKH